MATLLQHLLYAQFQDSGLVAKPGKTKGPRRSCQSVKNPVGKGHLLLNILAATNGFNGPIQRVEFADHLVTELLPQNREFRIDITGPDVWHAEFSVPNFTNISFAFSYAPIKAIF